MSFYVSAIRGSESVLAVGTARDRIRHRSAHLNTAYGVTVADGWCQR